MLCETDEREVGLELNCKGSHREGLDPEGGGQKEHGGCVFTHLFSNYYSSKIFSKAFFFIYKKAC